MYPFERFSEDAKKTLTLAQEDAERAHHSYIGPEHLRLGLLRLGEGTAFEVLTDLHVDIGRVRDLIATVLGRNERVAVWQIVPTSRVKIVIEIAFEEARRLGHDTVDTGHLLMALVMEGEGIAAHVLEDLGATAVVVVGALEKKWGIEASGRGKRTPIRIPVSTSLLNRMRLAGMRTVTMTRPAPAESDVETLQRLLATPYIADLLKAKGLDSEQLASQLQRPPESVLKLRSELAVARGDLADAAGAGDYARAARAQKLLARLTPKLSAAEQQWLRGLGT